MIYWYSKIEHEILKFVFYLIKIFLEINDLQIISEFSLYNNYNTNNNIYNTLYKVKTSFVKI